MSAAPVIVIGAGGHARVLLEALRRSGTKVLGVVDADPSAVDEKKLKAPLLGSDNIVFKHDPARVRLVNGVGSVRVSPRRQAVFERFKKHGYSFAAVVHPSAVVAEDVKLGEGAQIMAGVVLQSGVVIGVNAIVNTSASVDHDCVIGDHAHVAPGVTLSGDVRVGRGAHLGTGAKVIQGISIADDRLVRAGSVVLKDVRQKKGKS